jgi:hypothetical protein
MASQRNDCANAVTAPGEPPAEASPPVPRRTRRRGWAALLLGLSIAAAVPELTGKGPPRLLMLLGCPGAVDGASDTFSAAG